MIELIILIIKAIASAGEKSAGNRALNPTDAARLAEWERAQREWQAAQLRTMAGLPPAPTQGQRQLASARPGVRSARQSPPAMRVTPSPLRATPPVPVAAASMNVAPPMSVSAPIASRSEGSQPAEMIRAGGVNHRVQARARFILAEVLKPPMSLRAREAGAF